MSEIIFDTDTELRVSQIRTDGGTQMRAELSNAAIAEYAELLAGAPAGDWPFPPVTVYHDGSDYWLADGFHRLAALRKRFGADAGRLTVPAMVKQGGRREAILYAVGANAEHGLRRTSADKRRAIAALLTDSEWSQWADREIARYCHVDHKTVGALRHKLNRRTPNPSPTRKFIHRNGTEATFRMPSTPAPPPVPAKRPCAPANSDTGTYIITLSATAYHSLLAVLSPDSSGVDLRPAVWRAIRDALENAKPNPAVPNRQRSRSGGEAPSQAESEPNPSPWAIQMGIHDPQTVAVVRDLERNDRTWRALTNAERRPILAAYITWLIRHCHTLSETEFNKRKPSFMPSAWACMQNLGHSAWPKFLSDLQAREDEEYDR